MIVCFLLFHQQLYIPASSFISRVPRWDGAAKGWRMALHSCSVIFISYTQFAATNCPMFHFYLHYIIHPRAERSHVEMVGGAQKTVFFPHIIYTSSIFKSGGVGHYLLRRRISSRNECVATYSLHAIYILLILHFTWLIWPCVCEINFVLSDTHTTHAQ
jgi:hypothetical protein